MMFYCIIHKKSYDNQDYCSDCTAIEFPQHTDEMRCEHFYQSAIYHTNVGQVESPGVCMKCGYIEQAASAEAKYLPVIEKLVGALNSAPIIRLDDTLESARKKYGKWYRGKRHESIALAAPLLVGR